MGSIMDERKMQKKVNDAITKFLGVKKDQIVPEASLIGDLGADSLDLVELQMALEDAFDVEITDDEAEKLKTVSDIYNCLAEKTKQIN
jgi:acyl carrier protein